MVMVLGGAGWTSLSVSHITIASPTRSGPRISAKSRQEMRESLNLKGEAMPGDCNCGRRLQALQNWRSASSSLSAGHALRIDVERVHRSARRHEEPVAVQAAEAHVGAALGQIDAADELGFAVEDVDAVERLAPHAPAHPQVAVDIEPEAIGRAAGLGL